MHKGQVVELDVTNLTGGGEGVARREGLVVFVPGALPGERVRARINTLKKSYARAELLSVLRPAAGRIDPPCAGYAECGGCSLQHLDYDLQLAYKRQAVEDVLARIGGLAGVPVRPVMGMQYPWHYRNKVHFQVGGHEGALVLGYFAPGTHRLVPAAGRCRLLKQRLNEVAVVLRELLNDFRVKPYVWKDKKGLLRHVLLRRSESTGEVMAVLVTAPGRWPVADKLAEELVRRCPDVVSVVRNINQGPRGTVLGRKKLLLAGRPYITEKLSGLEYRLSAGPFWQVNTSQAEKLYREVLECAALGGKERVLDVYCGIGAITLILAGRAGEVTGVEFAPEAVRDARENARLNGIKNVRFLAGKAEEILPGLVAGDRTFDLAVLDPPRAGCEREVLQALVTGGISRIIYVSCNPATLARDLAPLHAHGYEVKYVQPVDMFPWTGHVECVVLLNHGCKPRVNHKPRGRFFWLR